MLTYRSLNALGCLRSASASVWPLSTSYTTCRVVSARLLFSVCCARMSSACTSGRPALIMVANWRVNTTTSRVLMPEPSFGSLNSAGAWRTCTTTMRFFRRWAMTSSRLGSSILSLTSSPLSVRAVYWKSGMAREASRRLPAGPYFGHAELRRPARPERLALIHQGLADHPQELVRVGRGAEALLLRDLAGDVQLVERVVQRLHAVLLPRLHR